MAPRAATLSRAILIRRSAASLDLFLADGKAVKV